MFPKISIRSVERTVDSKLGIVTYCVVYELSEYRPFGGRVTLVKTAICNDLYAGPWFDIDAIEEVSEFETLRLRRAALSTHAIMTHEAIVSTAEKQESPS